MILAGEGDKIVDFDRQSGRFHQEIAQSERLITKGGHMAHHVQPDSVVTAVDGVTASRKQERAARACERLRSSLSGLDHRRGPLVIGETPTGRVGVGTISHMRGLYADRPRERRSSS